MYIDLQGTYREQKNEQKEHECYSRGQEEEKIAVELANGRIEVHTSEHAVHVISRNRVGVQHGPSSTH